MAVFFGAIMEWYKRYTNRSSHGQLYAAGFWGGIVFDALCDSSAAYDLNGRVPQVYVSPDYLQRQLKLSESDFCGESRIVTTHEKGSVTHEKHVVTVLSDALKRVISTGLVRQEGELYIIDGWERKQRKAPKSDAERAREYRENKKLKKESVESESVTNRHVRDRDANVRVTERHDQSRVEKSREEKKEDVADATLETDLKETAPVDGQTQESLKTNAKAFQDAYNAKLGDALPQWSKDSHKRNAAVKTWLKSRTLDEWVALLETVKTRPFLLGQNDRGWRADALFLLKVENAIKIEEGGYVGKSTSHQLTAAPKPRPLSTAEALEKSLKEAKPLLPLKERNPKLWAENEARLAAQREEEKKKQEEWARYDMESNLKRQGGE